MKRLVSEDERRAARDWVETLKKGDKVKLASGGVDWEVDYINTVNWLAVSITVKRQAKAKGIGCGFVDRLKWVSHDALIKAYKATEEEE